MLYVAHNVFIREQELELTAVRARGAGGQNVNKVSSAVHLRFDIRASSLPQEFKQRLLQSHDQRISKDGVLNIKAQEFRNQKQNRNEALRRLKLLVQDAARVPEQRIATKPTRSSRDRRLQNKAHRAAIKSQRGRVYD